MIVFWFGPNTYGERYVNVDSTVANFIEELEIGTEFTDEDVYSTVDKAVIEGASSKKTYVHNGWDVDFVTSSEAMNGWSGRSIETISRYIDGHCKRVHMPDYTYCIWLERTATGYIRI